MHFELLQTTKIGRSQWAVVLYDCVAVTGYQAHRPGGLRHRWMGQVGEQHGAHRRPVRPIHFSGSTELLSNSWTHAAALVSAACRWWLAGRSHQRWDRPVPGSLLGL